MTASFRVHTERNSTSNLCRYITLLQPSRIECAATAADAAIATIVTVAENNAQAISNLQAHTTIHFNAEYTM